MEAIDDERMSKELLYWVQAIDDESTSEDKRDSPIGSAHTRAPDHLLERMALWQLTDERYGLRSFCSVRLDRRIRRFCDELETLYRRQLADGAIPPEAVSELYGRIDGQWAYAGMRRKFLIGLIQDRFLPIGGRTLVRMWMRGWSEAWMWLIAATRQHSEAQVRILVWTWARAGTTMHSLEYYARIRMLRKHLMQLLNI